MNNTNNPNNIDNTNVLPKLKTPVVFYGVITIIVFLIIVLICFLCKAPFPFSQTTSKSQEEIVRNVFIVLFFTLLITTTCIALLPNFKDLKTLFLQISNVTYVILYTVFLILFLRITPNNITNDYAYIIVPLTAIIGVFIFLKGAAQNYVSDFNVNYERIKAMILFFCLITLFITYYNIDPGGYIQKYFGYSLLLTIIISVFAFLYLVIVLTLSGTSEKNDKEGNYSNLLNKFTAISSYGAIAFFLFIAAITIVISTYPGGFFNDKTTSTSSMIIILLICVLSSIMLGAMQFPEISNNIPITNKFNLFKRSLLMLFGIVILGLTIFWIVYNIQSLSGTSSIITFVLNLLVVAIILGLIYNTIVVKMPVGNSNKNAFFTMLLNIFMYIPCLFTDTIANIRNFTNEQYNITSARSVVILLLLIALITFYFGAPYLFNLFKLQGGKQLVNNPVYTDTQYTLANYIQLNGSNKYDYQYGISFWVFLDSLPPNTNASYNNYTSLLNFGEKPNVLYNGKTHTLMITMQQKDEHDIRPGTLLDFDKNGNRIIYKTDEVLLQKWNNIIINYNGGVMDIFLNGELVKSNIGVVPYYTIDNLTIGEDTGVKGGICNVVYFNNPLNSSKIYYLYNSVKNRTPPVLDDSNTTIIKQDDTNL